MCIRDRRYIDISCLWQYIYDSMLVTWFSSGDHKPEVYLWQTKHCNKVLFLLFGCHNMNSFNDLLHLTDAWQVYYKPGGQGCGRHSMGENWGLCREFAYGYVMNNFSKCWYWCAICLGEMKKDKSIERGCSSCCSVLWLYGSAFVFSRSINLQNPFQLVQVNSKPG